MPFFRLFVVVASLALAGPAFAADAVFPKGGRVGLVPIEGLVPAVNFPGFQATDQRVKVVVTELPKDAFAKVEAAFKASPEAPGRPKLESIELPSGNKAFLTRETATEDGSGVRRFSLIVGGASFAGYVAAQVPDPAPPAFSDEAMRNMLTSVTLRLSVPPEEIADLLPFKMTEFGGFKNVRTLPPGNTLVLTDAVDEESLDTAPYMLIGIMASAPTTPDDRGRFAQQTITSLPGLREARITSSEPLRIEGTPGFETRMDAVTGKDNTPVTIVQWLRFGSGNSTLRIVAGAKRSDWLASLTRFRAVRDGIQPR